MHQLVQSHYRAPHLTCRVMHLCAAPACHKHATSPETGVCWGLVAAINDSPEPARAALAHTAGSTPGGIGAGLATRGSTRRLGGPLTGQRQRVGVFAHYWAIRSVVVLRYLDSPRCAASEFERFSARPSRRFRVISACHCRTGNQQFRRQPPRRQQPGATRADRRLRRRSRHRRRESRTVSPSPKRHCQLEPT